MTCNPKPTISPYTCNDYREEMIVLALRQKLRRTDLSEEERTKLVEEIARLEAAMGF